MSREQEERGLSTADLVAGTDKARDEPVRERMGSMAEARPDPMAADPQSQQQARPQGEQLAELFPQDVAQGFRSRWDDVQIGFVDDPKAAVQQADELVAQVMKSLAQSFAQQRSNIEAEVSGATDQSSTENLRIALRRYRSFFDRLLSL